MRSRTRTAVLIASIGSALWAASACMGQIGDPPSAPSSSESFSPPPPAMQRLLARQYVSSIRELLGDAAAAKANPPVDEAINGFDAVGASQLNVGDGGVAAYEKSARDVAAAAISDHTKISTYLDCTPAGPHDAACYKSFIEKFGHLAFRRPLADDEVADYLGIADLAATDFGTFDSGLERVIATMLEAPSFLYQVAVGDSATYTTATGHTVSLRKLSGPELATRISFFMIDTTPSADLLANAEAGGLDTPDGVRAIANELLQDPRARDSVRALYDEVLGVRDVVDNTKVTKDTSLFPQFTPALAQSMREETLRLVDDIVWDRNADFRELLTAKYTFVNPDLAKLYGMAPPSSGWARIDLSPDQPRAGFLGQASYLATYAHKSLTSPTLRGKFIRQRLLCQSINPPPNNVKQEFPPDSQAKTMREKLALHQQDPACAGCHKMMDPLGLAFESFDAIGSFRTTDNGETIDASGTFDGGGKFNDAAGLGSLVSQSPDFSECIVKNVYRHSVGHIETDGERGVIHDLSTSFQGNGYTLQDLLIEIVASDGFRWVGEEQ